MDLGIVAAYLFLLSADNRNFPKEKAPIMPWTVRTKEGESRSGHGISFEFNKNVPKTSKLAREARRLANRAKRVAWDHDSKASSNDLARMVASGYKAA